MNQKRRLPVGVEFAPNHKLIIRKVDKELKQRICKIISLFEISQKEQYSAYIEGEFPGVTILNYV